MKSLKFFAALAMPVMFAACTSEDVYTNDVPQKMEEVVGARLVGTDLSLDFVKGFDVESRKATDGSWHATDLIGLGWLVSGSSTAVQTPTTEPSNSNLYNNLMFHWNDNEQKFTAKGNIYEGWYFAYYPWSYMSAPGLTKTVSVNPEQVSSNPNDRMSQLLHLSSRQFISADPESGDIDTKTGDLKKAFRAIPVLNVLAVKTSAAEGSSFEKEKGLLANCEIESVTINVEAEKNIFSDGNLTIRAKQLPVYDETLVKKNVDGNDAALRSSLFNADPEKSVFVTNFTNTVTTNVKEGVYTVSDKASIYTLVVPATATLDEKKISINVKADCGDFLIDWVEDPEEGSIDATNNAALLAIANMYKKEGALTSYNSSVQSVNVVLQDADFTADFEIEDNDDWSKKVELANKLTLTNPEFAPEFTLAQNAEIVLSSKLALPTNGVTVLGNSKSKFVVEKSYTWNNKLVLKNNKLEVQVKENAKLTLNSGVELTNKVTNDGIITVKKGATLGKNSSFTNNKTVYVEFGGFVYPKTGFEGVIAYKVPKKYSLKSINDMIGTGTAGSANVNTLEINNDVDLKCQYETITDPEGSDNNPYNPTEGTPGSSSTLNLDLDGINLWINGTGKVSAKAPYTQKAKDVVINGGELSGIDIANNVTVKGGEATIAGGNIAGDVTVEAGSITMSNGGVAGNVILTSGESNFANVNIYGTLNIEAAATANMSNETNAIKVNKINNKGKLTSTSDINVVDIIADNCVIYLESEANAKDKVIWYSGNFDQIDGIELRGRILPVSADAFNDAISSVKKGETITLNSDLTLDKWSLLNPENVAYILDLNGNTLDIKGEENNMYSTEYMASNVTIKNGVVVDQLRINGNVTFENVTFKADYLDKANTPSIYWVGGNVTFVNCKFESEIGRHLEGAQGANATLTVTNCYFKAQPQAIPYINPLSSKGKVVLTENTFESGIGFDGLYNSEAKYTVSGNKFGGTFGFGADVSNVSELTKKSQTFCNSLLNNNEFYGANKIDVYSTTLGSSLYVNAGF